ncbi:MAG: UDP-glucose 4-epimerase, partial [Thermomicrobiales bacterium]|nr:UDP-glucose 4-epimerase [Thermomicrobiales bacterium]
GFIGSHLADRLVREGERVVVLDDLSTGSRTNIEHLVSSPSFRFVEGSVLDARLVANLVRGADTVYHLAAAVGVRRILEQPLSSIATNVDGTAAVLRAAHRYGVKTFLASTSEIYGKNEKSGLTELDDSIVGPLETTRWLYAVGKSLDEFLALAYSREHGLPVVIGRFFNTYGPRQTGSYGMVIPRFIGQALRGEPITIFGDGEQSRCFTFVHDAVDAVLALMRTPAAFGESVNIGNEREVTIHRLAELVLEATHSDSAIEHVDYRDVYPQGFADMRRRVPNAAKLRGLVGFSPDTPLEAGIRATIGQLERPLAMVAD